ncbi:TolC family protein [Caulobacter sp. SL161]|uniref:TolC family protein n=1 Tax=Caulobacter sp. SL161 TaxID=2995156 RepID=UPI002276664E|nr:TolC family protein [Caulobacter sp. SL161]MCY1649172.1 TolC family protein [Caulobacter sp. SL161]
MSSLSARPAVLGAVAVFASLGAPLCAAAAPITLAAALERAQAQSPLITSAQAALAAAQGRARQAGFSPNPEASLESENIAGSGPYEGFSGAETTFSIGKRLELGGKRRTRAAAAQAEVEAAVVRVAIARADLIQEVKTQYAEALEADARVALAKEAAERAEDLARVATTLVEAGREPPLRALRARTASDEADAAVLAAEAQAAAARRALTSLWADPDPAIELVEPPTGPAPSAVIDPTASLDVRLAQAEREAAQAAIDRERAAGKPDLTIQAGVRRFEQTGDQALVVGFTAPIPIRDRNQGNVAAARADATAAEARERLVLARSVRAVRDAQASLRAAAARLEVLQSRTVPQAQQAVDLARQGFQAGKFSLLDVLDAQAALSASRNDLIAARLERAKALAALERAAAQ